MSMIRSLSHICLSGIFIGGGWHAFQNPGGRATKVADAGIPEPERAVVLNGAAMVIGGTMLLLGIMPQLAALILLGTIVPTTVVGHAFWKEESDMGRMNQQTQFYKNLGLLGGLLLVLTEK